MKEMARSKGNQKKVRERKSRTTTTFLYQTTNAAVGTLVEKNGGN